MLLHHDVRRPIGCWRSWTESGDGLYVKGSLTLATRDAQEAYALTKDGALTGLSIGFSVKADQPNQRTGGRDLIDIDLMEGSLVTIPSNPRTHVALVKGITNARDIAEMLQEAGISGRKAKAAAGAAWRAIMDQSDEAAAEAEVAAILKASAARIAAIGDRS
jgi:hypothetical protein